MKDEWENLQEAKEKGKNKVMKSQAKNWLKQWGELENWTGKGEVN